MYDKIGKAFFLLILLGLIVSFGYFLKVDIIDHQGETIETQCNILNRTVTFHTLGCQKYDQVRESYYHYDCYKMYITLEVAGQSEINRHYEYGDEEHEGKAKKKINSLVSPIICYYHPDDMYSLTLNKLETSADRSGRVLILGMFLIFILCAGCILFAFAERHNSMKERMRNNLPIF